MNWKWRIEEMSYAQFNKLSSTKKQEHIEFLLSLPQQELGTNDQYILRFYGPEQKPIINKFLNLNENGIQ